MAIKSTIPADSRPDGPGKPTSCHRLVAFTDGEPNRLPPVWKPMRHLVIVVAHLAVRIAFAVALADIKSLVSAQLSDHPLDSAFELRQANWISQKLQRKARLSVNGL